MIKLTVLLQQIGSETWCQTPGTYTAYKTGEPFNTDYGIYFKPTKQSAESFMNPNHMLATAYEIRIINPLIAKTVKEAYQNIVATADEQLLDTINVNNIVSGRRPLHMKVVLAAKLLGHDSILYLSASGNPQKRLLCIFDNASITRGR